MYAQLNRLLVGTDLFSLNMELKQDGRTVCCNYTDVGREAPGTGKKKEGGRGLEEALWAFLGSILCLPLV